VGFPQRQPVEPHFADYHARHVAFLYNKSFRRTAERLSRFGGIVSPLGEFNRYMIKFKVFIMGTH